MVVVVLSLLTMQRNRWARSMIVIEMVRLGAAALMVFTLLRPERVTLEKLEKDPLIAIVMDGSGSMDTQDVWNNGKDVETRAHWLSAQTNRVFWAPLEEKYQIAVEVFNQKVRGATDIHNALAEVSKAHENLRAILMLTDGDWNEGPSPIAAATKLRARNVPVFGVAVGSERYLPDLVLESVSSPAYGLLDEQISIPYSLRSRLGREVQARISLVGTDGTEVSKVISLPAMSLVQDSVVLTPKYPGDYNFTLRVDALPEEAVKNNNSQTFQMNFRREVLRVLVIESSPRWEYRFLHNALSRDPGVEADFLLMHPQLGVGGGRNYLKRFPASRETLSQYDVVFLGDVGVGDGGITEAQAEMIKGLVEQQGSGLVFLPGMRGGQNNLIEHSLAELNPVVMDPSHPKGHGFSSPSRMVLTTRGKDHLLTLLGAPGRTNQLIWEGLPGFYWHAAVLRARAESTVLAVHATARSKQGRVPLLATKNCGNGKSLFLGTDGAWRWRRGVEDTYHYRFWGQVVRWMAHQRHLAYEEGIRFFFSPEAPSKGSDVFLHATVFDQSGFPVEKGAVVARIETPSGKKEAIELVPEPGGWGVFTGTLGVEEGGDYQVNLSCEDAQREVATKLFVTSPVREVIGRPVRSQVLREIAEMTNGRIAKMSELDDLVQSLNILPERKPVEQRFRLWSHPVWAGLIVALLAIYWTLRKWIGLI